VGVDPITIFYATAGLCITTFLYALAWLPRWCLGQFTVMRLGGVTPWSLAIGLTSVFPLLPACL
jgi:hypothetical protein